MHGVRFIHDKKDHVVWGPYSKDAYTGEVTWLCREYYGDGSLYLTTREINEQLQWMERTGQAVMF